VRDPAPRVGYLIPSEAQLVAQGMYALALGTVVEEGVTEKGHDPVHDAGRALGGVVHAGLLAGDDVSLATQERFDK
jgi:hypothetical protein